jgi:cytochrome c-type biogenesis protein CcmH/NrfF
LFISTVLGAATTDDDQELVAQVKNTHAQAATISVKVKCLVVSNKYHVVYAGTTL